MDNTAIIAAAVSSIGVQGERTDDQYREELFRSVTTIRAEAAEPVARDGAFRDPQTAGEFLAAINRVEEHMAAGRTKDGGKIIVGVTVRSAEMEKPKEQGRRASGRVLVTLTSFNQETGAWEDEVARTERLRLWDGGWNWASRSVADTAKALVGHKVKVWIEMVEMGSGENMRTIRLIQDLGPDEDYDENATHGPRPRRTNR